MRHFAPWDLAQGKVLVGMANETHGYAAVQSRLRHDEEIGMGNVETRGRTVENPEAVGTWDERCPRWTCSSLIPHSSYSSYLVTPSN